MQGSSQGSSLFSQLRNFSLPSSSSPPNLYRASPRLKEIYGESDEEEDEEADALR